MTKKIEYSKPKAQWITRFDARAIAAKAKKEDAKHDVAEAQSILRKLALFSVSSDPNDLSALALLKAKGIDQVYFSVFAHYNDRLTALSLAGAADPRVEVVISPAEHQRLAVIYEVYSALRSACGNAGESIGRAEDARPAGRGAKVALTATGVLEIIQQFLSNSALLTELLDDAAIGEEELDELRGYVTELQAMIASKESRGSAKGKRTEDIELTLLAAEAAIALYKGRAKTATRHSVALLPRALAPFPRAPERRKPAAPSDKPGDSKADAKSESKADAKSEPKMDEQSVAGAETPAKAAAPAQSEAPAAPPAAAP